jgi:hypothetical protein
MMPVVKLLLSMQAHVSPANQSRAARQNESRQEVGRFASAALLELGYVLNHPVRNMAFRL